MIVLPTFGRSAQPFLQSENHVNNQRENAPFVSKRGTLFWKIEESRDGELIYIYSL
jgi:hypothetical protein